MKQTPYNPLTPAEINEENEIEERRIAFLDAAFAALSEAEQEKLLTKMQITVNEALGKLCKKRSLAGSIVELPSGLVKMGLYFMTSDEARNYHGGRNVKIASGIADTERSIILLLKHLALAPKEVIERVAIHEALHILYARAGKENQELPIRNSIKWEYLPEVHQEEEWVRRMEEQVCGKDDLFMAWELAVEHGGKDWRNCYYKLKKAKIWRRFDDYASPDLTERSQRQPSFFGTSRNPSRPRNCVSGSLVNLAKLSCQTVLSVLPSRARHAFAWILLSIRYLLGE